MSVPTFTYPATRPQKRSTVSRSGTWVAVCRYCFLGVALVLGLTVVGCSIYSGGNQNLTDATVAHIKKGVTTESQVIALLGQPDSISLMGDGRRVMIYMRTKDDNNNGQFIASELIPFAALIPSHTTQTTHTWMLQIIVGKNQIVQDYQYSDNASQTNTTVSMFGAHTEQRAVTPTTGP